MPYVKRNTHKHAAKRRFKRRLRRGILFLAVIIAATYALNFFLNFSQFVPKAYEPKDFEREMLMKKLEEAGKKAGQIPPQPARR